MGDSQNNKRDTLKKVFFGALGGAGAVVAYNLVTAPATQAPPPPGFISYSSFMDMAKKGEIPQVSIRESYMGGRHANGHELKTYMPAGDATAISELRSTGKVDIISYPPPQPDGLTSFLNNWGPTLLMAGVFIFFLTWMARRQAANGRNAMGFGKSKAKQLQDSNLSRVTFEDVAGIEEAKEDLQEIVEFLKNPQKFTRLGGKIPKGALLVGPPGTGKTLISRAVAGEANVPFFSISGSDFVEMFVGVGASRVRDMFEQAKKNAPCIIFIDEIDAVGKKRGSGMNGNDEREQTLNQMLVEMDGFEGNEGIIILAATNRVDTLDPALLRPGRFDRKIEVPNPDIGGREKILRVHMKKCPLEMDVSVHILAKGTPGFSGAQLAGLVNEAALLAARRNKKVVGMQEFEDAREKIIMGAERKSAVVSEDVKRQVSIHEAGHVVTAMHMHKKGYSSPVHKVTNIGRGPAGGYMARLFNEDRMQSLGMLKADIVVAVGGRIAEQVMLNENDVSIGASGDIQQVTSIVRAMVMKAGFSDKDGLRFMGYEDQQGGAFAISEETKRLIELEAQQLVDEAYKDAKQILEEHKEQLMGVTNALMEYESLTGEEATTAAEAGPDKAVGAVAALRSQKEALRRQSTLLPGRSLSVPAAEPADIHPA